MRKIKANIYAVLGLTMCWASLRQGNYGIAAGVAVFVALAIWVTLASLGQTEIVWDEQGITVTKKPKPPKHLAWEDIRKLKVDHLGYQVFGRTADFRIRRETMPAELLAKIRQSIRQNNA